MAGSTQIRNSEQVNLLRADFQPRYEPNFAWKSAVSSLLALPGLRACWPMSSVDYAAATQCRDVSGGGYHLTNNAGVVTFMNTNLAPSAVFGGGANQYLSRPDGGAANWADITGLEAFISSPGLYIGGWFSFGAVGATQTLISKWAAAGNQRSYLLQTGIANTVTFAISGNGIASASITSTATISATGAYFISARYIPGAEMKVWVNQTSATLAAGIPVSIFDGTADFQIGAIGGPANYLTGRASLCWLGNSTVADYYIDAFYQQTRAMFGV